MIRWLRSWFVKKRPPEMPWYYESAEKRAKAKEARKELKEKLK